MSDLKGHNNPPADPVSDAIAPYQDDLIEAEQWLDGQPVETDAALAAAECLLARTKDAARAHDAARTEASAPLHAAWQAKLAEWKPQGEHIKRIADGLKAIIDPYKRKRDALAEEARRRAAAEAAEARRKADEAARAASAADMSSVLEAQRAQQEAVGASARARAAEAQRERGMRTHTVTEVLDMDAWSKIAWQHHQPECEAFLADLAARNRVNIPGVVETRKERRVA